MPDQQQPPAPLQRTATALGALLAAVLILASLALVTVLELNGRPTSTVVGLITSLLAPAVLALLAPAVIGRVESIRADVSQIKQQTNGQLTTALAERDAAITELAALRAALCMTEPHDDVDQRPHLPRTEDG